MKPQTWNKKLLIMDCCFYYFLISFKMMDFQWALITFKRQLSLRSWGRKGLREDQEAAQLKSENSGLCCRQEAPATRLHHISARRPSVCQAISLNISFHLYKMEPIISALAHSQDWGKDGFNVIQTNISGTSNVTGVELDTEVTDMGDEV